MSRPLLEVRDLSLAFGGVKAIHAVSVQVHPGQIYSVIGPNGAGKTSFFNCVSGVYSPTQGEILFEGHRISGLVAHKVTGLGIARTFQNIRLFGGMTALENVQVGLYPRTRAGVFSALIRPRGFLREEEEGRRKAFDLLELAGLGEVAWTDAAALPYGLRRRLEIARALATRPKLLLLDEPAAGLNRGEKESLMELIRTIQGRGITVLLIEHDMELVMEISHRIAVLDHGIRIAEGTPDEIRANPHVIDAYLGRGEDGNDED